MSTKKHASINEIVSVLIGALYTGSVVVKKTGTSFEMSDISNGTKCKFTAEEAKFHFGEKEFIATDGKYNFYFVNGIIQIMQHELLTVADKKVIIKPVDNAVKKSGCSHNPAFTRCL